MCDVETWEVVRLEVGLSVVFEVFVELTENPALDEEESTLDGADELKESKYVCVAKKIDIAAGADSKLDVASLGLVDTEFDVAAAMVADALRKVAATSVPGTGCHWCHLRAYRYMPWTPVPLFGRAKYWTAKAGTAGSWSWKKPLSLVEAKRHDKLERAATSKYVANRRALNAIMMQGEGL